MPSDNTTDLEGEVWRLVQEETDTCVASIVACIHDGRMSFGDAADAILEHCKSYHKHASDHGI